MPTAVLPTPPVAAGDEHGAVGRCETALFEGDDRECGRVAGGADHHGVAQRETGRDGNEPVGRDPGVLGKPTVAGDAELVPVGEDLGADGEPAVVALGHHAGEIDPGDDRRDAGDPPRGRGCQPILVVDARPVHLDQHAVGRQVVARTRRDAALHGVALRVGEEGAEGGVGHGIDRSDAFISA